MNIEHAKYNGEQEFDSEGEPILRFIDAIIDGASVTIPDTMSNRHRRELAEWEAEGNTIEPFVAPRAADVLDQWRAGASVSRRDFCLALYGAGILPKDQAILAAKGDWPPAFDAFLTGLTDAEATAAQIEWASVRRIHRAHPMIEGLAGLAGLTPDQVDTLFRCDPDAPSVA